MEKINRYLFLFLFLVLATTFVTRNNCRGVDQICPEVLNQPRQTELIEPQVIKFTRNDYAYELIPRYDYEINALVVSKLNYKRFSIEKFDKVFPLDLALIWGSNVASGVYKNRALKFSQDGRWAFVRWYGNVKFDFNELSNNHLLINDSLLENTANSLVVGDQVKIKGKLVNVKADLVGKRGTYDSSSYTWNSSASRTDSGAGACEVIYVEDIEILKKANLLSSYLFTISLYGLLSLMIWNIYRFFTPTP